MEVEHKTFRILGLASDYWVVFFVFNTKYASPLSNAFDRGGYGHPSRYLFMWRPTGHHNQDMYQDTRNSGGHNLPEGEYTQIFRFVDKHWDVLEDGTPLELYLDEKDSFIACRKRAL